MAMYARNPLVRNYLGKLMERQKPIDYSEWYKVNLQQLSSDLIERFMESNFDAGTEEFLENCYKKSDWVFTQMFNSLARVFLSWFMSMTTVNGLLNRGSMFIFSENQFNSLLNINRTWKAQSLLDLGAGDGKVSQKILHHFEEKFATEQSPTMQWRLKENGFQILDIDKWQVSNKYSVITALNLLDRIDKPMALLREIHASVKPDGHVLIAIVLPYHPCYESGPSFGTPSETLPIHGLSVEAQIESLKKLFDHVGFALVKFTKLPYLCEGDLHHDFFYLNDIVFVLRKHVAAEENNL